MNTIEKTAAEIESKCQKVAVLQVRDDHERVLIPVWEQAKAEAIDRARHAAQKAVGEKNYNWMAFEASAGPREWVNLSKVARSRYSEVDRIRAARKEIRDDARHNTGRATKLDRAILHRQPGAFAELAAERRKAREILPIFDRGMRVSLEAIVARGISGRVGQWLQSVLAPRVQWQVGV